MPISDTNSTNDNDEAKILDTSNLGGLDTILNLVSGVPQELKVGASKKVNRRYVVFQALDNNIVFGFTNSTQSLKIFKNQTLIIPIGEGTEVWFDVTTSTGDIAIGELS